MTDKRLADEQLTADDVDKSGDASPEPQGAFPRASESTLAQRRLSNLFFLSFVSCLLYIYRTLS